MKVQQLKNFLAISFACVLISLPPYGSTKGVVEEAKATPLVPLAEQPEEVKPTAFSLACPDVSKESREAVHIAAALEEAASSHQIEVELLAAIMLAESKCQTNAKSRAGARGLMQLMPQTAKWLGVSNLDSTRENVFAAAKYLSILLRSFNGNLELALAAYNCGPEAVRRYRSVPPFKETKSYVKKVLTQYQALQQSAKI